MYVAIGLISVLQICIFSALSTDLLIQCCWVGGGVLSKHTDNLTFYLFLNFGQAMVTGIYLFIYL
jgi:hypothetical protein